MARYFGKASDFFEVKLFKIEEVIPEEFDWDELTAYIGPRSKGDPSLKIIYQIQIRDTESGAMIKNIDFENLEEAKLKLEAVFDDLRELEVEEFCKKHQILLED
jgi:hypothetical protein